MNIKAATVFCGSKPGNDIAYVQVAENIGQMLANKGITFAMAPIIPLLPPPYTNVMPLLASI